MVLTFSADEYLISLGVLADSNIAETAAHLSFFFSARKHHVLTLITNPVIWPFFSFCSLPVTLPIEVLKMIWTRKTWSPPNTPFHLLLSFALIPFWCLYWGQKGKEGKGYLFISILILGKGDWESKTVTPWPPFCVWGCNTQCMLCGWS